MADVIELHRVTVQFGNRVVLSDLNLHVAAGERVALLGPNGAGKTTLIRALLGQVSFAGSISVGGFDILRNGISARKLIGYVPQTPAFPAGLTAAEVVAFFQELRAQRADPLPVLDAVGLRAESTKTIRMLSGGMVRRLALAVARIANPPLLIFDEPASHLDRTGEKLLAGWLQQAREAGRTVVLATHHLDGLEALVDRFVMLDAGRVTTDVAASVVTGARWIEVITEPPIIALPSGVTVLPNSNGALHLRVDIGALAETMRALGGRPVKLSQPTLTDVLEELRP